MGRLVVFLGGMPAKLAPTLIIVSLLLFVGGILVEGKLKIETDPVAWVNPDSTAVRQIHAVEDQVGISSELGIYVEAGNVFSDRVVKFVDGFTSDQLCDYGPRNRTPVGCTPAQLRTPKVKRVLVNASSIVSIVSYLTEVPGTKSVPPTGAQVKSVWEVAPAGSRHRRRARTVTP